MDLVAMTSAAQSLFALLFSAILIGPTLAHATVVVDGTRVIYPAARHEVSVNVRNVGEMPSLVEVWIDTGNERSRPDDSSAPIVATPPLFRINPTQGQTLRLMYTQGPLPTDRESVFWLNVLDIPPRAKPNPDAPNHLEMAFRHRLKIFFRPTALRGDPADAAKAVVWSLVTGADGPALVARNPTPFYISFIGAELSTGTEKRAPRNEARAEMVPPMSSKSFVLARPELHSAGPVTVHYSFINDFGASVAGDAPAGFAP
jgi:chaperone protein EcpD